eukprot:6486183-Amphidinium_carterae.1
MSCRLDGATKQLKLKKVASLSEVCLSEWRVVWRGGGLFSRQGCTYQGLCAREKGTGLKEAIPINEGCLC